MVLRSDGPPSPPKRLACVDVPALPLQCLVRREPALAEQPAVIVNELQPNGVVLWSNRAARAGGVRSGQRYGHALGLCGQLRAGLVTEAEQQAAISEIADILRTFTPLVEPARQEPGVFWLDGNGLGRFAADRELPQVHVLWTAAIRQKLLDAHWHAAVVLGFDRLATYAIARHFRGVRVLADPLRETRTCGRVQLASLGPTWGIAPKLRDELERLGVATLGDLAQLPETALRERMGLQVAMLRRRLARDVPMPLAAELPVVPAAASRAFEPPDHNAERLLFAAKGLLATLLPLLAERREAVAAVELRLELEGAMPLLVALKPAMPTLNEPQILELVRLFLARTVLAAAVHTLHLRLQGAPATAAQLALWQLHGKRDPEAAALALARLRALFGEEAVVVAVPRSAWLPEGQFAWQPLHKLTVAPQPPPPPPPDNVIRLPQQPALHMVRRILSQPVRLPPRPADRPWRLAPFRAETVVAFAGPYRLAGGWWRSLSQTDRCRDYGYATTDRGTVLWVFCDVVRNAWFCQGILE